MIERLRHRWKSFTDASAARRFVAVDFDSRQVRIVQAERAGAGIRILRILGRPAPEGMDLADPRAVGEFIRGALKENNLSGWPLVMCVPRGMAVLKTLAFPPGTSQEELAGMVQYQVEKELPFRPEEAVVDFTAESHFHAGASPEEAGGKRVLVAAVRVPVVDYYRQIATAAGARLFRLGLRPYANHRCFVASMSASAGEKCALVHITADETEIDVVAGESLAFSRSALGKIPAEGTAPQAEMQEAAAGLVTEIVRSLQSYQSVEGGGKVDRVYVAGGTGIEPLVAKGLSERLGIRCLMFNPSEGMRLAHRGGSASEFISALGLAVGSVAAPLDFLRPKRPSAPRNTQRNRLLALAAGLVVLVVAGVITGSSYLGAKESRFNELQSNYRKLEVRKKAMDGSAARAAAIEAWEKKGQNWLDHIALLSALFPDAREAYTGAIASGENGSFSFTVHAAGEQTITEIAKRLDQAGYEAKVLKQYKTNDSRYPHTADMRIAPGPKMDSVDLVSLKAAPRPEDDLGPLEPLPRPRFTPPPSGNQGGPRPPPQFTPIPSPNSSPSPTPVRDPNRRSFRGGGGRPGG
jgi:type IV pilus assembly protein PilM